MLDMWSSDHPSAWLCLPVPSQRDLSSRPHDHLSSLLRTGGRQLKMVACRLLWVITSPGLLPGVQQIVNDGLCERGEVGGRGGGTQAARFSAEGTTDTVFFSKSLSWDHMLESVSGGDGTRHQSMIAMSGRKICQKVNLELRERPLVVGRGLHPKPRLSLLFTHKYKLEALS